jgi:hypothetical protein
LPRRYRVTIAGKITNIGARTREESMKCDDYDLPTCRDKIFDRLRDIWNETRDSTDPDIKEAWDTDIWRKANTLQALALYWNTTNDGARRQKAMDIMKEGYEFYKDFVNCPTKSKGIWVDDFGWWYGFFSDLAAHDSKLAKPFNAANLLCEAQYCYRRMLMNFDPKEGGVWNYEGGPQSEKNTVTNAWMLNVAAGLFKWTNEPHYKNMAEAQYLWLTTGKYKNYSPPNGWSLYNPEELLWWLPGPPKTSGQYWSGDEGVFLRGLMWYIDGVVTDPAVKTQLLGDCKKLIIAAITPTDFLKKPVAHKGFPDTDNVMHESPASNWGTTDLPTGKGVFMRLVTRFAIHYKYFGAPSFKEMFRTFVDATAQSVWCSRDNTTNRTGANWNCPFANTDCSLGPPEEGNAPRDGLLWPQVWQTDGLDALNAAVEFHAAG